MKLKKAIEELEAGGQNVRFDRLIAIVEAFFGKLRVRGSHHAAKTPWKDRQIILQPRRDGKAKEYQTKQVIAALRQLGEENPHLLTTE